MHFKFVFDRNNLSLNYRVDEVNDTQFPFRLNNSALTLTYSDGVTLPKLQLHVSDLYVSTQFENCQRVLETTFLASNLTITTASGILPFVFSQISHLRLFAPGIDPVEFIGHFSVASSSDFAIVAPCTVHFWSALEVGAFARAFLNRVFVQTSGSLSVESGASIQFARSVFMGEVHFHMRPAQPLGRINVEADSDFSPSALFIDLAAADWSTPLNESFPLICGQFDCEFVHSRSRFAMIDTAEGFYMFRGYCGEDESVSCYVLTSVFTPNTPTGVDDWTLALIWSIAGMVIVVVLLTILFSWYLYRRRGLQSEIEPPEGSTRLRTFGV
jgi:hypothetical protein